MESRVCCSAKAKADEYERERLYRGGDSVSPNNSTRRLLNPPLGVRRRIFCRRYIGP